MNALMWPATCYMRLALEGDYRHYRYSILTEQDLLKWDVPNSWDDLQWALTSFARTEYEFWSNL